MPINCPINIPHYNACLVCRNRGGKACVVKWFLSVPLTDILTTGERLAILEDSDKPDDPEWSVKQWKYVKELKGQVIFLQNKVNELLKTRKQKSKYE